MVICVYYFDEYLQWQNDSHNNIPNYNVLVLKKKSGKIRCTLEKKLILSKKEFKHDK